MNTVLALDPASAAAPATFFLNASTEPGFTPPCPAGAWNGITHQIRNRMKTQTLSPKYRWQLKPTPEAFSLPDGNTDQAAQAVLVPAGDA